MIMDFENLFSKDQQVTATALSDNTIDLGQGDAGPSERLSLVVYAEPFTGDGEMCVELMTANGKPGDMEPAVTVALFAVSNEALKKGGKLVAARLPHGLKRYALLNYTTSGDVSGKITAGLALDVEAPMPDGLLQAKD